MRAVPLTGTDLWTVLRDDGSAIKLMGRDATWRSENAAEAYIEFITAPKPRVKKPDIERADKKLSQIARDDMIEQIAIKYGVTVPEMMARANNLRS